MDEKDVAILLKGTHQGITQIMQKKIDEYGLTFGQLHLMMLIEKCPSASQKELAKEMRFTQGAMSIVVKRLIASNMLEQVPLEMDMRYNRLVITEIGKTMINDYREDLLRKYRDVFVGFSQDELGELSKLLLKINSNLSAINSNDEFDNLGV